MRAPSWYEPLTPAEQVELLRLVEKACGVPMQPPCRITPADWLIEFNQFAGAHVATMQKHVRQLSPKPDGRQPEHFYDPRLRGIAFVPQPQG